MTHITHRLGLVLFSIVLGACYARGTATVRTAGEPAPADRGSSGGVVVASGEPVTAGDDRGRGDPHEGGERGDPHDDGEHGDPHDGATPAAGGSSAGGASASADGPGRGDPHEDGERGDPHDEGERGDPHDDDGSPGRGRGR